MAATASYAFTSIRRMGSRRFRRRVSFVSRRGVSEIRELLLNTQREQHEQRRQMAQRLSAHTNLDKYAVVDPPRWRTHGGEEFLFSQAYNDALIFGDAQGTAYMDLVHPIAATGALNRLTPAWRALVLIRCHTRTSC